MTNDTATAEAVFSQIKDAAERHANPEVRFVRTMQVGQWVRQGDINIARVGDRAARGTETWRRQLAPGETQGSRHVVADGGVRVYLPAKPGPLVGPVIVAKERCVVTHPEHAHVSLPSGTYAVTFQRNYAMEEITRVQD